MNTNIIKLSDINTTQKTNAADTQASRFQRLINALFVTLMPGTASKKLSNLSQLTDKSANDYIDLACRKIRTTKDFNEALKFAGNVKELTRLMPHFNDYLHILGEALIDQVTEYQAKEMIYVVNVSKDRQENLSNSITQIACLTRFRVGTKTIIQSKIGQRLEEIWTADKLIRDFKDEYQKHFNETASEEQQTTYLKLKTESLSKLSFVRRIQLDHEMRQLFKERNVILDPYRKQLWALGLQGVYDDIIPDVFKEDLKEKQAKKAQIEYTNWVEISEKYAKQASVFKNAFKKQNIVDNGKRAAIEHLASPPVTPLTENQFNPTVLQRIIARIKELWSHKANLPPSEVCEDHNAAATVTQSDDDKKRSSKKRTPSFIKNATNVESTSPFSSEDSSGEVSEDERRDNRSDWEIFNERAKAIALAVKFPYKFTNMEQAIQFLRNGEELPPVTATTQI